jgi:preprotein translocase subunit SecE
MADENDTEHDDEQDDDESSAEGEGAADEPSEPVAPSRAPSSSDRDEPASDRDASARDASDRGASDRDESDRDESDEARLAREERELRKDSEQAAREADARREDDAGAITGTLGLERWVQFAFIALAVGLVYVTDKLVTFIWEFFAEPDPTIVTITAVAVSLAVSYVLYQNMRVRDFASEVVSEMSKVTWPTRDETWYSTLVVIGASFVAALYTGALDALWSALTDMIYG